MTTPPLVEPRAPTSGELPVNDSDDVWEIIPADKKNSDDKPILDAMVEAFTEIALAWEDIGTDAAEQSSTSTADEQYLDGLGNDREIHRAENEKDDPYRDRVNEIPKLVSNEAILAAVNKILAPYTDVEAQLFDSIVDRLFLTDGTLAWHSFLGANPQYFIRLYPGDEVANGGFSRPQSKPGGAWMFSGQIGRMFVLRVPSLAAVAASHSYIYLRTSSPQPNPQGRMFLGDGTQSVAVSYLAKNGKTELAIYQSIADQVNKIVGQGIRWMLDVDPKLV